jgi:hypothetical protein
MGGMSGGGFGGRASGFSDAGYANRKSTGYRAGNSSGPSGSDSRARNPRYAQNNIATRPATFENIATALSSAIPGVGAMRTATALATGGSIDPYSGPIGKTTGYSYDGPNRFGLTGRRRSTALGAFSGGKDKLGA